MTKNNTNSINGTINIRYFACQSLYEILEENKFSHVVIRECLKKNMQLTRQDRSFYSRLVKGTIERKLTLDTIINQFSKTKIKKMKPYIRTILRMSVYQIYYMKQVPDHAICNEAVKLTIKKGYVGLKGFVNGVLRTISREKENIKWPQEDKEIEQYLSISYSIPIELVNRLIRSFGLEKAKIIAKSQLNEESTAIWCNENKQSLDWLKEQLKNKVNITSLPYGLKGFYLSDFDGVESLSLFREGYFLIQDVSSMLAGIVTNAKINDFVIDVCAAPGGKALHAALEMKNTGHVEAFDLTKEKVNMIEENKNRLQLKNLSASVADARIFIPQLEEKADIVIADLPCSGLGIIGRKPEIKYRVTDEEIKSLAALQKEILSVAWRYVKPGGRLIYSTCTWTKEENIENYEWIIENFPFVRENIDIYLPQELHTQTTKEGYLTLLPGVNKSDGFFISSAIKKRLD